MTIEFPFVSCSGLFDDKVNGCESDGHTVE